MAQIFSKSNIIIKNIIKYLIFLFLFAIIFLYEHILINIKYIRVEINNNFETSFYENNINFSNYLTEIKPIAMYYPEFNYFNKYFKFTNNFYNKSNILIHNYIYEIISKQIQLAKSHGIYGFAIYYFFDFNKNITNYITNNIINLFVESKEISFYFLLIWKNENFEELINQNKDNLNRLHIIGKELDKFIINIKKYLISKNYIKINNKPAISISSPSIFQHLNEIIFILREKTIENGIGKIFILYPLNNTLINSKDIILFDAVYDISKKNLFEQDEKKQNILYYSGMIYKNALFNSINYNFTIYRTSILEICNNSLYQSLKDYTPEKYYILNNIIINWTKMNLNKTSGFFFINSWNNYEDGNYLEPDEKYGYASINSLSRSLFGLSFKDNNYNLLYLDKMCQIAIQAHVYYDDLINEIVLKSNNMPTKFDLFISTISLIKKEKIEKFVKKFSKANNYEIKIFENKGRDILPFLNQMKFKIKKYKYICHIHTKKSKHDTALGLNWRNYLYENLLGSKDIISDILNDFGNYKTLGFIFPEVYYDIIKEIVSYDSIDFPLHKPNQKYMNFILKQIFPKFKIGYKIIFPTGDMFWTKVNAIYQIFGIRFKKKFQKESNQTNETIMHGMERIWLYLVKLNGYYYNIIFKHY